ncbi:MAG: stalk domain-containing protein [Candidatus Syntrophopropionicum ammoniitolerans]
MELTALLKDDRSYVSLEQLSDLLGLPLDIEEGDGQQYASLSLNDNQSVRCIANNKNAVVNNHEFQLDSPPFWLPAGSCRFWIPLRNWAEMVGADVNWSAQQEVPPVLNLSGCALQ